MTRNIIHLTQGICKCQFVKEIKKNGIIFHHIRYDGELECPCCGSRNVIRKGIVHRSIQGVPIRLTPVYLELDIPRIQCKDCQKVRQIKISFADPFKRHTKNFENFVLSLIGVMTDVDIARLLHVSWDTIREIESEYLKKHFSRPSLKGVRWIAIDEIAIKKGHKYLTVVMDLESGKVIHVGYGKDGKSLEIFWKRLKRSKARIECVSVDLSPAYTAAIEKHLPEATIVYDHFHVVKLFNDMLSQARRDLYNKLTDQEEKRLVKGTRFILLKRPENLDPDKGEPERLQKALELNKDLLNLYYLKDEFNSLWSTPDRTMAEGKLSDWLATAEQMPIPALQRFCKSIRRHAIGIINWHDFPISSGPLEGLNNKIKTLKRQAYGYRNLEFFKLKILAIHTARYALVG